jgi:hypothetical protein
MTAQKTQVCDPKRANKAAKTVTARRQLQATNQITNNDRLGYRLAEFAAMCGISLPTLWRRVREGDIKVVVVGGIKLIPRAEVVRLGLVPSQDERVPV